MDIEYKALEENTTWILIDFPNGKVYLFVANGFTKLNIVITVQYS